MKGLGQTPLLGDRRDFMPPQLKTKQYNPIFYFYRVHWIPNVIWSPDNVLAEIKLKDVDAIDVWKIRDPKILEDLAEKFANLAMIATI